MEQLFGLKKLVYLFGDTSLYNITESIVLITNESEMESISSTVIDFSESLSLKLHLCNFDPEGDFESKQKIIEHYETLSQIFYYEITVDQERVNPVRKLQNLSAVIQLSAFNLNTSKRSIFNFVSTRVQDYLLTIENHPKILVPVEVSES
jgi:hypothetical protein